MRYAVREYAMGRANAICDTRIRYLSCECDMRYANTLRPRECDIRYANRLRTMSNCKVAFSATIINSDLGLHLIELGFAVVDYNVSDPW